MKNKGNINCQPDEAEIIFENSAIKKVQKVQPWIMMTHRQREPHNSEGNSNFKVALITPHPLVIG
jgi:hypothetical protein